MLLKNHRKTVPDNFRDKLYEGELPKEVDKVISPIESNIDEVIYHSVRGTSPIESNMVYDFDARSTVNSIQKMLWVSLSLAIFHFAIFIPKYYVSSPEAMSYFNIMVINIYLVIFVMTIRTNTMRMASYADRYYFGYIRRKFNKYVNLTGAVTILLFVEMFVKIIRDNLHPLMFFVTVGFLAAVLTIFFKAVLRDSYTISEAERNLR